MSSSSSTLDRLVADMTGLAIVVTKHHGLGNDFLVAVDPARPLTANDAVRWCDRRRGVGADGLITAEPMAEDIWAMTMWNSDGSRPEVSGNGLRCLGQALARHRSVDGPARFTVRTDGGMRTLDVEPDRRSDAAQVRVDMGAATATAATSDAWSALGIDVRSQQGVSIGNPHLVAIVDEVRTLDPAAFGPSVEADFSSGINVHVVEVADRSTLRLRVWERGAGVTEACGSGACAAAWAANRLDLVDDTVEVVMPGGSATVELDEGADGATVYLTGPATFVATVVLGE